jgi:RNA polymerase sigma-70 factor (ECF subfamily)
MSETGASAPVADEAALVAGLRERRPDAFETMVRVYTPRLLAVARRLVGNDEDARDVVQDAMLSAYRSIDKFEANSRVSTWLHRIVVNAGLMKLRTRRRKPEESIEPLLPTFREDGHYRNELPAWAAASDETAERNEMQQIVREAILNLPDAYREVVVLRDIEEQDTAATAAALGITPNAVKIRLHRARQALRTQLEQHLRRGRS